MDSHLGGNEGREIKTGNYRQSHGDTRGGGPLYTVDQGCPDVPD